ncbi:polysaccharide biosynthesis/export family protein [Neolewinella litorea]|uniref:polysaccharide biosynthesis/export family protein n=1 Tax=Neolewinella litorea TaxID=2562452 RepID=UPI001455DF02|nr:polysaccharide biosynthesis/export family protein [Neolewinella litorea]
MLARILFICVLGFLFSSCIQHRELLNFSEGEFPDSVANTPPLMIIQPDDLLSIQVITPDVETSAPYNLFPSNTNITSSGGSRPLVGYLVDATGKIEFPGIGRMEVAGMTVEELKQKLQTGLSDLLINPAIIIRFINFRITVDGEVNTPGSFIMPNERVTVLDATGLASGLTEYANRTNILIIREQNGERQFGRINLRDRDVVNSPYYYLRQNDYIYVEPLPERTATVRDQTQRIVQWGSVGASLISLIFVIFSR